jgi:hypothetical protein
VQDFVRRKSQEKRLKDRLHAIWFVPFFYYPLALSDLQSLSRYCVPMDNNRPSLDLQHFYDICPDKNGMSKSEALNWD